MLLVIGRNEKLRLAKPELVAQIEFTDAGRSPETFKVCRVEGR
jgi:hypothetical protein